MTDDTESTLHPELDRRLGRIEGMLDVLIARTEYLTENQLGDHERIRRLETSPPTNGAASER